MICNYQNINEYCSKQYSYSFINTISNNGVVDIDKSETAPVLRTDNFTGNTKIISPDSTDLITSCEINDDNEGTTEWECYLIYRYLYNGIISDPSLEVLQNGQKNIIDDAYELSLSDGVEVTINDQPVVLSASLQDQIVYKSILSYAQALYDDDSDAIMPSFTDINNNVYILSYETLILVFKTYFTKVIYYKNLKDTLIGEVDKAVSLNDLQQINWCSTKPLVGNLVSTKIVSFVNKTAIQNCEDIEIVGPPPNPPQDCDPPCDPNSCENCIDGNCESLCSEGECCNDGVCEECSCDCTVSYFIGTCGWECPNGFTYSQQIDDVACIATCTKYFGADDEGECQEIVSSLPCYDPPDGGACIFPTGFCE
jgi:hypothetical protein